ncbi:MAG: hypothetical protein NUV52_02545 [Candidatus Roizmanbacteria bacterium]|nr:hypothetical protein [Candidatus Roizmanbacteria bacterium]
MDLPKRWNGYRYKNLTYLGISIAVSFYLFTNQSFQEVLLRMGEWGYIGAFISGILFVSTFTVSIGIVLLLTLAERLNPLELGFIAGLGAVTGDFFIFHYIRNKSLVDEIKHFFVYFGGDRVAYLLHTKYFSWSLPVAGALIIASPLPDELGVGLMGISKMKTNQFLLLSFALNFLGIFLVISASTFIKP